MTEIEKIQQIAEQVRKEVVGEFDPNGFCKDASDYLVELLKKAGLQQARMVHGTVGGLTHWWVRLDNTLIDVTGDQFHNSRIPPILITPWDGWDGLYVEDE